MNKMFIFLYFFPYLTCTLSAQEMDFFSDVLKIIITDNYAVDNKDDIEIIAIEENALLWEAIILVDGNIFEITIDNVNLRLFLNDGTYKILLYESEPLPYPFTRAVVDKTWIYSYLLKRQGGHYNKKRACQFHEGDAR